MRPEAAEQRRQQGNLIRLGTVAELDLRVARCRIRTGEITTDWIPWLVPRAGSTMEWSAPSIGEQGIVLCPDGDTFGAVFLRGLYSDALPPPSSNDRLHLSRFPDGAAMCYDDKLHRHEVSMPAKSKMAVLSPGGIETTGSMKAADNLHAGTGASGSFTTPTGLTVMVQGGIIINIF